MVRNSTNNKHLERLERLFEASTDRRFTPIDPDWVAILNEYSDMKAAMAENCSRGGVRIEPQNIAHEFYGRSYTQREFLSLCVARALEKRGCYGAAEIAEQLDAYVDVLDEGGRDDYIGAID